MPKLCCLSVQVAALGLNAQQGSKASSAPRGSCAFA